MVLLHMFLGEADKLADQGFLKEAIVCIKNAQCCRGLSTYRKIVLHTILKGMTQELLHGRK